MSYESIQARLQKVPVGGVLGVDTWQFRRWVSPPGQEPRLYSAWYKLSGLPTGKGFRQQFDQDRTNWKDTDVQRFRTPDNWPLPWLALGDQLMDDARGVWAVVEQPTSGPGTVAYTIQRDTPLLADAGRKGGV